MIFPFKVLEMVTEQQTTTSGGFEYFL